MDVESVVVLVLLCIGIIAVVITMYVAAQRRQVVESTSAALAQLTQLNAKYSQRLTYLGPIFYDWVDVVNSKARLDRYDLNNFFYAQLALHEAEIQRQLTLQVKDINLYRQYQQLYDQLARQIGVSNAHELSAEQYVRIERKLYTKRRLREPVLAAQVRCTVRYTSPQGQNNYAKWQGWDFDQLRNGLIEMRRIRSHQSTAKFLRQQERNRMSGSLRYQVLKRDNSRCQRCGASALTQGVTLHVDHIVPVSKGGKTVLENLQTLCEACNLGKSNRH